MVGVVADRSHWGAHTNACIEVIESPLTGEELVSSLLRPRRASRPDERAVPVHGRQRGTPCPGTATGSPTGSSLPLASHAVVEMLMDKVSFARHAAEVRTSGAADRGGPEPAAELAAAAARVDFPCVLKPPTKSATWLAHTSAKGFAATDVDQLLSLYDKVGTWSPLLLVQEWVDGPEDGLFSCNAYFGRNGTPLATFVARKVRQWPPEIGTSASGEECRNDEVLDTTVRLFGDVGFHGLAYLEMKRDVRTGRLMIIEPNVGRPTGRSAIAEAGGVELVYTAYCDAAGLPLPDARDTALRRREVARPAPRRPSRRGRPSAGHPLGR